MIGRHIYILLLSAVLAAAACQKPESPEIPGPDAPAPIMFSAKSEAVVPVKAGAGSEITDDSNLVSGDFGIYGMYFPWEDATEGTNVFLSSSAMRVSHDGTQWTYSPTAYWSINQFYRFRSYHPYEGDAFVVNPLSDTHKLMIEYKVAAGQEDLMVGFTTVEANVVNIQKKVPVKFKHALCALRFKIAFKDSPDIPDDYTDAVTMFHLHGIIPSGTLVYGHEPGDLSAESLKWIATYYDEGDYYDWTGSKEFGKYDENDEDSAVTVFDGTEGLVFAIPQQISSTDKMLTSVHFTTLRGGAADHYATIPTITWEPGKIYTYTLLIEKSEIQVLVSIKDWNEIQSNENIYI